MISIQEVFFVATKGVKRKRGRPKGPRQSHKLDNLLNLNVTDITDYYSLCQFLVKNLFFFTYILCGINVCSEQGSEF